MLGGNSEHCRHALRPVGLHDQVSSCFPPLLPLLPPPSSPPPPLFSAPPSPPHPPVTTSVSPSRPVALRCLPSGPSSRKTIPRPFHVLLLVPLPSPPSWRSGTRREPKKAAAARRHFSVAEGDHISLLNVYRAASRHLNDPRWLTTRSISPKVMLRSERPPSPPPCFAFGVSSSTSCCCVGGLAGARRVEEVRNQLKKMLKRFEIPIVSCGCLLRASARVVALSSVLFGVEGKAARKTEGRAHKRVGIAPLSERNLV